MKILIDTSSLLSLVRYYLPFDQEKILYSAFRSKIESGVVLFLDKVFEESHISKGLILKSLPFLTNKKIRINTSTILPNQKFFNQLENQFINGSAKNRISEVEFENSKSKYLESADCKLLLYGLKLKSDGEKFIIVSEETTASNDNKSFKKLPTICKILEVDIITLPDLLNMFEDFSIQIR